MSKTIKKVDPPVGLIAREPWLQKNLDPRVALPVRLDPTKSTPAQRQEKQKP